jgi:HAD superfamily hydrolase (TIGR01509 family)
MVRAVFIRRRCWIFDMDGTLTVPVHDFDAIRDALGLQPGLPILEQLAGLSEAEAAPIHEKLGRIELDLAARGRAWPGVEGLLTALQERGARLGIVTRNRSDLARITLDVAGLGGFFVDEDIVGRDDAPPKPAPDGILGLLARWGASPSDAVMTGDYLFDLQAGRAAGTATILLDHDGTRPWREHADLVVSRLDASLLQEAR